MFKFQNKTFRKNGTALAAVFFLLAAGAASAHVDDHVYTFNIPAENTAKALNDFARQANLQIMFPYGLAAKHTAPAISGQFTRGEILARLLDGTGLEVAAQSDASITIRVAATPAKSSSAADEGTTEVVVTGTHIRGGNPTSPVHTVTRKDIERSGYSQIGDLMRSLPENFSGGNNPGVFGAAGDIGNQNTSDASTINLRGLGTSATLVLLNGHRLSGEAFFQGADISGIPLAAVQRIEVVSDGASALYGSDAVAGVVNILLKKRYQGVELGVRVGGATQGGGSQQTYTMLAGTSKADWYALANLEYAKQDAITAGERQFTKDVTADSTLISPQERRSLFVAAGRQVSDALSLSFDAMVNDRRSTKIDDYSYGTYTRSTYTPGYSVSASADLSLAGDWRIHGTAVSSGSHNNLEVLYLGTLSPSDFNNHVEYFEATADGSLLTLPSGPVKVAVGGGYRRDRFQNGYPGSGSTLGFVKARRTVSYMFAEALIPLVAPSTERTGLHRLEINLSERAEDYSDFGRTATPKLGVRYVPFNDLTLRATAGKSFKAPSFQQMYESYQLYLFPAAPAGYSGGTASSTALIANGGNPDLKPEKSTSWTVGADYAPTYDPSLVVSATYFNIDFSGRVFQPIDPLTQSLSGKAEFAPFVQFNPTAQQLADLVAKADVFINYTGSPYVPGNVVGIAYNNYQNAASQHIRGLDLAYRQSFRLPAVTLDAFANATWLQIRQRATVTSPEVELTGTIFNAPKFKSRAGVSLQRGGLSVTGLVNYIGAETDTGVTPHIGIASWTTADLTIGYNFGVANGNDKGVKLVLAVSNLFDKAPPRAVSPALAFPGTYFDSTNTSVIGRFVSIGVSKAW